MSKKKKWRVVDMREAVKHAAGRTVDEIAVEPSRPDYDTAVERFTDGTAIGCKSDARGGGYSEYTPEVDLDPPIWWIYD